MNDSDPTIPEPRPPMVIPVRRPPRPEDRRRDSPREPGAGMGRVLLVLMLLGSVGLNVLFCFGAIGALGLFGGGSSADGGVPVIEKHWAGDATNKDKVAIIQLEGVLVDGLTDHMLRQIDKAAKDDNVKAVVVRINSPGGTITASDELHKRLTELRDGNKIRFDSPAKPLVVSMGAMAASGGYYIAVPAKHIFAEKTTTTGSIGVYSTFLNVHKLAKEHGVSMELVKAGEVKAAGSPFHEMKPEERQVWQDMVDNAYAQFIEIVEAGRPGLKGKLTKDLVRVDGAGNKLPTEIPVRDDKGEPIPGKTVPYKRKLADGGIFTAQEAKRYELIDEIGYLEDAVKKAAQLAALSDYRTVIYDKPVTLLSLLGMQAKQSQKSEFLRLAEAAGPRLWYLAPNSEFAGMLAVMGKE